MQTTTSDTSATAAIDWRSQPHAIVERDGVRYTLLGTAHVSQASVDAVRAAIASDRYDAVAVELDERRLQALTRSDALTDLDLIKVLREGKAALFAAHLGLAAYQRRLAEQLGVEPGAELKAAAQDAQARGLPLQLIDRDVGLTFKRASQRLGWWGRAKLGSGLLAGMFVDEELGADDIEKLKQGDMLEAAFSEFASDTPALYDTVIAERDRYMAARLREQAAQLCAPAKTEGRHEVLAVVGAGHLQGLSTHLREETAEPALLRAELEQVRQKSRIPWFTICLTALVLGGLTWGFWQGGFDVGADLLKQWVFFTAGFAALGCTLAGGHPLSILTAAVIAPLKPFRPGMPTGLFSALVELRMRKPNYGDFMALRDDVQTAKGWWRNRVTRVLLTFFLTSMGSAVGVWTGGLRIIGRLVA